MKFNEKVPPYEDNFPDFKKYFIWIKFLGRGGFGRCDLAEEITTGKKYAVKVKK